MPDADHYELVDGKLINTWSSGWASWTMSIVTGELLNYVMDKKLGIALASTAQYQCFPDDANRIRKPDVSFISRGRIPASFFTDDFILIPPDLAVEVVSDHDRYEIVNVKVQEYLRAGVRLVWVLDPETKSICVHRQSRNRSRLEVSDELSGEEVLPGFSVAVTALFPPLPGKW